MLSLAKWVLLIISALVLFLVGVAAGSTGQRNVDISFYQPNVDTVLQENEVLKKSLNVTDVEFKRVEDQLKSPPPSLVCFSLPYTSISSCK